MSARKEPLSVEALLEKQRQEANVKPKFLTKAERQKLALEKREAEIKEKREREEKERLARLEFERKARERERASAASAVAGDRHRDEYGRGDYGRGGRDRDGYGPRGYDRGGRDGYDRRYDERDRDRHAYGDGYSNGHARGQADAGRADRDRYGVNGRASNGHSKELSHADRSTPASSASDTLSHRGGAEIEQGGPGGDKGVPLTEAEQKLIKERYLGIRQPHKKKTRRMLNDKRYMFDHDVETDDTTDKVRPDLAELQVEAKTFGAGGRAGMDPTEYGHNGTANGNGTSDMIERVTRRGAKSAFVEKHWSEKSLEEMKERDWRIFREDFAIAARGGNIPRPLRSWRESSIPLPILDVIETVGYTDPSPIQRQAIPIGLQNRDLIGIAETGSGKTASFVIPMLAYISQLPRMTDANKHLGPYALIIAPTRELAQQIEGETRKFTDALGFRVVSIVGGRDMNEQAFNLRDGAEVIVATPGRLKDCVERHVLVLSQCLYLVLDEADKSIGLGFADVLDYILDSMPASNLKPDTEEAENPLALLRTDGVEADIPRYRVTMLYSATMPPSVERLARNYLRRPATITIGDANQAVGTVEQRVEFVSGEEKRKKRLMQILASGFEPPIIVFATTKQAVDSLAKEIQRAGYNPAVLHSGKTQTQREDALAALRSGDCPVLVATDLAGRGIDVPDVSLVVNVFFPTNMEAYIHRIGRTGRAGKRGLAITFIDSNDEEFFYDLKQELSRSPLSTVPRELERHPAAQTRMTREMKRRRDDDA